MLKSIIARVTVNDFYEEANRYERISKYSIIMISFTRDLIVEAQTKQNVH